MNGEVGMKVTDGDEGRCGGGGGDRWRRWDLRMVALRVACLATSLLSMSVTVTSEERSTLAIYGFRIPVHSKWSYSESLEFLVGATAAVAAHSLLQLVLLARSIAGNAPVIPSRNYAWLVFAADQALAYAMVSAGSAAAGVTNLNRTGIRHSPLPDFCKPLRGFCDRMAVSIAFGFLTCTLLATSAVLDVMWLSLRRPS